jgi:hypothetical protein
MTCAKVHPNVEITCDLGDHEGPCQADWPEHGRVEWEYNERGTVKRSKLLKEEIDCALAGCDIGSDDCTHVRAVPCYGAGEPTPIGTTIPGEPFDDEEEDAEAHMAHVPDKEAGE